MVASGATCATWCGTNDEERGEAARVPVVAAQVVNGSLDVDLIQDLVSDCLGCVQIASKSSTAVVCDSTKPKQISMPPGCGAASVLCIWLLVHLIWGESDARARERVRPCLAGAKARTHTHTARP